MPRCLTVSARLLFLCVCFTAAMLRSTPIVGANPYVAKPGEAPVTVYVATCAVSGGFVQLYTALDHKLFDKYGIAVKHVVIRGGTNINLAALGTDEVQFLYCAADSTLPGMAVGRDATLIASPLVGLPYVIIARKEIRTAGLEGKIHRCRQRRGLALSPAADLRQKVRFERHADSTGRRKPTGTLQCDVTRDHRLGAVHAADGCARTQGRLQSRLPHE